MFLLFCVVGTADAQDILVKKDGNIVKAKVMEITPTEIKYKRFSNPDGPLYTIEKNVVLSIVYENGEKELFENLGTPAVSSEQPESVDYSISYEENEQLKRKYYADVSVTADQVKKLSKKDKGAGTFYCQFMFTSDAVLADKNIEIEIKSLYKGSTYRMFSVNQSFQVIIKNKSNRVVFIDLANSYFIRGEMTSPYYVPASTVDTNTKNKGISVNVGSVASALGVGGAVGTLASGINVGGSNTNSETTITFSQRIVSIPPMSLLELDPVLLFTESTSDANGIKVSRFYGANGGYPCFENLGFKQGKVYDWTEENTKFKFASFITYSFEENLQDVQTIKTEMYANRLIGLPSNINYGRAAVPVSRLTDNFNKTLFFVGTFEWLKM